MDLLIQLQQEFDVRPGQDFLDHALATVKTSGHGSTLREVAGWALSSAGQRGADESYGLLQMLAGAASARARLLAEPVEPVTDEGTLLGALCALQDRLDAGLDRRRALDDFALLGAQLLVTPLPRYFDMRLRTDPDDTVFYWASGAMALKQGS